MPEDDISFQHFLIEFISEIQKICYILVDEMRNLKNIEEAVN